MAPRVAMPQGLTFGDSIAVALIVALYLVMLAGVAIVMPTRKLLRRLG